MRTRPVSSEYPGYYDRYVSLVPDGTIEETLRHQHADTMAVLDAVSEEAAAGSYAPGKWTLKEVVGHLADTERVMAYRMLAVARGETAALPGFNQDVYVASADFNQHSWTLLRADLAAVRSATLSLLSTIDDAAWVRQGTVWNSPVPARAIAHIIAGHELHHLAVIREKYL